MESREALELVRKFLTTTRCDSALRSAIGGFEDGAWNYSIEQLEEVIRTIDIAINRIDECLKAYNYFYYVTEEEFIRQLRILRERIKNTLNHANLGDWPPSRHYCELLDLAVSYLN